MGWTFDPATGAVTETPVSPAVVAHRTGITTADGLAKPANNNANWAANPGGKLRCDVFVTSTGAPTTLTLRPYVRQGGSTGVVGTGPPQTFNGGPNNDAFFSIQVNGGDLLVFIETLAGGTTPAVTVSLVWS